MDDLVHQLLDAFIPRPVFYILARFSNLIYRLFFGLYNDPTSWKSTLLPPLIALLAGYLALLTVYRTVQSTARLVWWSVKWGVILGAVFGGYAWWTSEAGTINSTGQPSSGFWSGVGSVANGAARDLPMTPVTLSGLAAWLPFLATLQQQQKPYRAPARQAQLNRRVKRDGAAAAVDVTNLGSSIPSVARQMGLDVSDEEVREIGGFLQPLLNSIGLGGLAAEHEGGQARASDPRRRARAGATGAEQRRDAGQRLRTGAASRENAAGEGLWSNFAGFDLGLPDDDDDYFIPVKGDVDDDDGDDGYGGDDVASWRTRSRKTATDRARRRREDEARRARRRREATQTRSRAGLGRRGGAADVEHTRQELAGALRELVRDLFG